MVGQHVLLFSQCFKIPFPQGHYQDYLAKELSPYLVQLHLPLGSKMIIDSLQN